MLILEEGILTAMMICSKMVGLPEPGMGVGLIVPSCILRVVLSSFFPHSLHAKHSLCQKPPSESFLSSAEYTVLLHLLHGLPPPYLGGILTSC